MRKDTLTRPPPVFGWAAALLATALAAAPARAQDDPAGSWSSRNPVQVFAQGGHASDGAYLYIVGGLQGATFDEVRRYDPASDTFQTLGSLPFEVSDNAAAVVGGTLYSLGGFDLTNGGVTDVILAYDIATDAWSDTGARLTSARMQLAAAAQGGVVYSAGGLDAGFNFTSEADAFNPAGPTVTAIDAVDEALSMSSMAVAGGRIFLAGGFGDMGPSASLYEYLAGSDAWTARASMRDSGGNLQYRYAPGTFSLQGRLYVTGGFFEGSEATTYEYNPADDTWARRADMAGSRHFHAAGALGDLGLVAGGSGNASVEAFTPPDFSPPSNAAPVADAGADHAVEAASTNGASVTLSGSGTDADGDALTYSWTGPFGQASGAAPTVLLALGSHELTLTVSDGTDSDTDTVTVTVEDTTAPTLSDLSASPSVIKAHNKKMKQVVISATAEDAADAAPTVEIVSVCSNQAVGEQPDWEITGDLTLLVRAERANNQSRVYTITVRSTDASGNSSDATVTVTVAAKNDGDGEAELHDAGCDQKGKHKGHHK
jgi:N-acetylneuraminic acid mutarotase